MFQSVEELSQKLSETGYFIDPTMTKVVFLADQMKKPLLAGRARRLGQNSISDICGCGCRHTRGTVAVLSGGQRGAGHRPLR